MRINDNLPSREVEKKSGKSKSTSKGKGGAGTSLFAVRLTKSEKELSDDQAAELQELKQRIEQAGDDLDRDPTMANFKAFRDLLGAFARKASAEAYRVERVRSSGITPHEHELVTVIDREADELYHLIVSEQKNRIAITAKIMRIKGLVVNFST